MKKKENKVIGSIKKIANQVDLFGETVTFQING